ncbi:AraC family transcriptional regulator [Flammeovirgaceae bacterium SG7u.111]|nr:AraC family transcriptional regulator [Flammeovirgaceae bacterium SG7u.132]WPO37390.1 AraC family transcriptional regulator [Flammeovirgaceae bacterium SG7u.111]
MEDYNKIIESLTSKFIRSGYLNVVKPVTITNYYDFQNTMLLLKSGSISFGPNNETLSPGDILFIPGGSNVRLTFGTGTAEEVTNEDFIGKKDDFVKPRTNSNGIMIETVASMASVSFDVKAFDSVHFFTSLDVPPFLLAQNGNITRLIDNINQELHENKIGSSRMTNLYIDQLVIDLFRYILNNNFFVEQLSTNINYFKDPRLIDIFNYIKENLAGDLSNKVLANVANVSEDYVGQYFKMLTGINPQDYIEYQRMEQAVSLLRTSKKSIRAIGTEVGYKDTAYFCRRFKMMFGIPAGKMRRRESLIDV